ncbi:hypothetical protein CHISP_2335 [Chitinispirillum alkaliphilum]|nr:hypothetical protein CHISP_2335 [Chitinispirillum alkaliphilum]
MGFMPLKTKLIFPILISFLATAVYASSHASAFQFVEEPVNPRNIAMGSAGTAMRGTGFSFYNPAQPFLSRVPYVSVEFGQIHGDINRGTAETAIVSPNWFAGISFITQSIDFPTSTEQGVGPKATNQGTVASFTAGFIRDDFAAAITLNGLQDRFGHSATYHGLSFSGGITYRLIPGKLELGLAGFNVGRSKGFLDDQHWRNHGIPRTLRAGGAWSDKINDMPYTVTSDLVYRDETGQLLLPVGVELYTLPSLAVRLGKKFFHDTDIFTAGIGINLDNIALDLSFVPTKLESDYDIKWSVGLSYYLGARY